MQQLTGARLDNLGAVLEHTDRTWTAGSVVTDALTRPRPPASGTR